MRVCQNKVIGTSSFFFVSFFKKASSRPFWIDFSFDSILIAYHLIKRCFQSNFPVIKALCYPFSYFCTHLFYVEGYGKEGKVHGDFVESEVAESTVCHIVFHLSENGFWLYRSFGSVFKSLFRNQLLTGFAFIFHESVVNFDGAIPLGLEASCPKWASFAPCCPVAM